MRAEKKPPLRRSLENYDPLINWNLVKKSPLQLLYSKI